MQGPSWPGESHPSAGQDWSNGSALARPGTERPGWTPDPEQGHQATLRNHQLHLQLPPTYARLAPVDDGTAARQLRLAPSLASGSHPGPGAHDSLPAPLASTSTFDLQAYAAYPTPTHPLPLPAHVPPGFAYEAPAPAAPPSFADPHLSAHSPYAQAPATEYPFWIDAHGLPQAPPPPPPHLGGSTVAGLGQLRSASVDAGQPHGRLMAMAHAHDDTVSSSWPANAPAQQQTVFPPTPLPHQDLQPGSYPGARAHFAPSFVLPNATPYGDYSATPSFGGPSTSLWVQQQAYDPSPSSAPGDSSAPANSSTSRPHLPRVSTFPPPSGLSSSFASYAHPGSPPGFLASQASLAGPSANKKRSRGGTGPAEGGSSASASRRPSRASQASQNPNKKLTVDLHTTCAVCGVPVARLILRGKRAELDVPHSAVFTCLACSASAASTGDEKKKDKPKKPSFRKRNKRFDDPSATVACDVCLRDIAVGGVLPLPPDPTTAAAPIEFMVEIVCVACDAKYKRCSDCGGGGGSRAGTGKWRCAELFPPQRKTCSLKHQRLGAFPDMSYSVLRNTEIPTDEVDELSQTLEGMFVNAMLAGLCIPEVLEQDGAVFTSYEACYARATMGWKGFDPLLRYDIEQESAIRRYLALRTCTPNLRKPTRQTPDDSPADSPEPAFGPVSGKKRDGVVLKEGKEIAGFIIAEHELLIGSLFLCIVLPWDPTGEIFDATSLLISALIRHVDADVKTTNLQRVQQGLSPYPDIARVWTMLFFKRDSRVLTSLVKKRGFQYLEDYLADHPEVPREQFPPHRPCYLPVGPAQEGWEILVRQQRTMADGSVDDWGARRPADEERGKKKELRAKAAAANSGSR